MVYFDRVLETSTTTGTGSYTLAGAQTGYQSFSVVGNGNLATYSAWAVDASGNPTGVWEVGVGTWATGGILARTTFLASSTGSPISWAAGTKWIALTIAAAKLGTMAEQNANVVAITGGTGVFSSLQLDGFNDLTLLPSTTGNPVTLTTTGGDTYVPILLSPKGFGSYVAGEFDHYKTGVEIANQPIPDALLSAVGGAANGLTVAGGLATITIASPNSIGGGSSLNMVGTRGTLTAPTKTLSGDSSFELLGWGYNAVDGYLNSISIYGTAIEDWTLTGHFGSKIEFYASTLHLLDLNPSGDGKSQFFYAALVPDEVYGSGWNGSLEVPTKNAVYDKIETLGNPFSDALALVKNSADATKLAIFSAAGITTGTTRIYTLPNATDTLAALGLAQTWTGVQQFGTIGGAVSKLAIAGSTSGKAILDAPAVAGTAVITLPGITSTLATLGANTFTAGQTITAGTVASQIPIISATQTWNNSGAQMLGLSIIITDTASAGNSLAAYIQVGATALLQLSKAGALTIATDLGARSALFSFSGTNAVAVSAAGAGMAVGSTGSFSATSVASGNSTSDTFWTRGGAAATWQAGAPNAASPIAQTLQAQGSRAGTDSNVGGANYTWQPGTGTGTGTAASAIISAPTVVASGTGAQTIAEICRFNTTTGVTVKSGVALQLGNAAVTGLAAGVLAATTNATVTITDSAGQVYRVPCII